MGDLDRPLWPTVKLERPWSLPAIFWDFATPWAWVRIYGHMGEKVLFHWWYWSRGPIWWLEDKRTSADWWVQGKVKDAHEARLRRKALRERETARLGSTETAANGEGGTGCQSESRRP